MSTSELKESPIRIGISTCLLGEKVRFDGGHKKDRYLTEVLGGFFEWVPVCPEVEVGMGTPREPIRLTGTPDDPHLVGVKSGTDWTERMHKYSAGRVEELRPLELSGYILKSDSPSCGMERVRVYNEGSGMPARTGRGLFAAALMKQMPLLPVEEEGRLNDAKIRENFIVRVFGYHRLLGLLRDGFQRGALVRFHTIHKYLMLAHSPQHYRLLGRLVAGAAEMPKAALRDNYSALFMEGLTVRSTVKKNVNVLQHIFGFLSTHLASSEKVDILTVIDEYHNELVPLVVPLTLLRHYVVKHDIVYIRDQVYLNPHPRELMLRNHV